MKKQLIITLEGPQGAGKTRFGQILFEIIQKEFLYGKKIVVFNDDEPSRDDPRTYRADIIIQTKQNGN